MTLPTAPTPYSLPALQFDAGRLAEFNEQIDRQLDDLERRHASPQRRRPKGLPIFGQINFSRRRPKPR